MTTAKCLLGLFFISGCGTKQVYADKDLQASDPKPEIQTLMDTAQKNGGLPAIGALVTFKGKTYFFGSQGQRAVQHDIQVSESDQWHLGSDTKAITAFLIALAVQDGKLTYDSSINRLLHSKKTHVLNQDLTVKQLLSHSSGLKDVQEVQGGKLWKDLFNSTKPLNVQRMEMSLASLQEAPILDKGAGKPIRNFHYGNINYIILGAVLENLYSSSWEKLLTERVFNKLTMNSCGFGVAGNEFETIPSQPWPHVIDNGKLIGIPPKEKADNPPMLGPAGTVHCNLRDWHKFIIELLRTWKGTGNLITDQSVAKVYFEKGNESYTFGGWGRNDDKFKTPLFQHSGSNTFNFASAEFLPEKDLIILIVTNRGDDVAETAMRDFLKSLNRLFL